MDVTDATFETDVLERSSQTTVVVDLWASWCGPCRTLGPILENVVGASTDVELVKVDVDANPGPSATFQVQSIPAVFAIKDRKVVDSFVGALPEPAVRQWVSGLHPAPTEVDRLVAAGDEASLRQALELEPGNERVVLALGTLLVARGDEASRQETLALLSPPPRNRGNPAPGRPGPARRAARRSGRRRHRGHPGQPARTGPAGRGSTAGVHRSARAARPGRPPHGRLPQGADGPLVLIARLRPRPPTGSDRPASGVGEKER